MTEDQKLRRKEKQREYQRNYRARNKDNPEHKSRVAAQEKRRPKRNRAPEPSYWYTIKHKYGLTKDQWEALFASQGGTCAICKTDTPGYIRWHTDHCHETNKVRGILCHGCNVGLGGFKDSQSSLRAAASYLEKR